MITVRDALNRGYNLLGVGIIAISGLSFFSDLPAEIDQPLHIVDEVLLAILALVAFIWYLAGRNKYSRTVMPIIFAVLALAIKVLGLFLELGNPEDRGMNLAHWSFLGSRSLSWSGNTSPPAAWLRVSKRRNRQQMQSRPGSGGPREDEKKERKKKKRKERIDVTAYARLRSSLSSWTKQHRHNRGTGGATCL